MLSISQRALDYLIATRRYQRIALTAGLLSPSPSFGNMHEATIQSGSCLRPLGLGVIGCSSGCNEWV